MNEKNNESDIVENFELNKLLNSTNISIDQLPLVIQEQFSQLQLVKDNVDTATKKAEEALEDAKSTKNKSAGFTERRKTIEALQEVTYKVADAQKTSTDAQKVSFDYMKKLGEVTKFLFGLGVSNIANNRAVIRELKLKLDNASKEELDELARQEIMSVIKQLKAQEDIMIKQEILSKIAKEHEERLYVVDAKDKAQDKEILRQAEKDVEHDRRLDEGDVKDKVQDEEIARQAEKDAEHDKRLDEGDAKDKAQDEEIARQAVQEEEMSREIQLLKVRCSKQEELINSLTYRCIELEERAKLFAKSVDDMDEALQQFISTKYNKALGFVTMGLAIGALILSIINVLF